MIVKNMLMVKNIVAVLLKDEGWGICSTMLEIFSNMNLNMLICFTLKKNMSLQVSFLH